MKKILLATALAAVSVSATSAKGWGGFYARGALAAIGKGKTNKTGDLENGASALDLPLELAAGWGMVFSNAVYLGVDAQVGNFMINYNKPDVEDSLTKVAWTPNLQARVGAPLSVALPYVGVGIGYNKVVSETGNDNLPDGRVTWSVRVGSDFKVNDNFFVGVYGNFAKDFNEENGEGAAKTTVGTSAFTFGFTAGYQF